MQHERYSRRLLLTLDLTLWTQGKYQSLEIDVYIYMKPPDLIWTQHHLTTLLPRSLKERWKTWKDRVQDCHRNTNIKVWQLSQIQTVTGWKRIKSWKTWSAAFRKDKRKQESRLGGGQSMWNLHWGASSTSVRFCGELLSVGSGGGGVVGGVEGDTCCDGSCTGERRGLGGTRRWVFPKGKTACGQGKRWWSYFKNGESDLTSYTETSNWTGSCKENYIYLWKQLLL